MSLPAAAISTVCLLRPVSRQALVDIQYGRADDTFGWLHQVC